MGRTDERSQAEWAALLLMHPLNMALISQRADAAGKHRSSGIDVLMHPLLSITPRGAGLVCGRVSGCHRPPDTITSMCQNSKGSIDSSAGGNR